MVSETKTTIMPIFRELASIDAKTRIQQSEKLIINLSKFQKDFIDKQVSKEEWDLKLKQVQEGENIENILHGDVYYSLVRLIKGLASPADGARQGFSLALTELLRMLNFLPIKQIVEILLEHNQFGSNTKNEIARNAIFGRLFGLQAISSSNLLEAQHVSLEDWKLVIDTCYTLFNTKVYINEACSKFLYELITKASQTKYKNELGEYLWRKTNAIKIVYPDELLLYIAILTYFPNILAEGIEPSFELLYPQNFKDLASILWRHRQNQTNNLPIVWTLLFEGFFSNNPLSPLIQHSFGLFWKVCVDENLFLKKSVEPEKQFLGLQVLQYALPLLNSDQFPLIFTENLIFSLMNTNHTKFLKKHVNQTIDKLVKTLPNHPRAAWILASKLHNFNFDKRSEDKKSPKQQLINQVLQGMNKEGISEFIEYLIKVFNGIEKLDGLSPSASQEWAINQMQAILKNAKVKRHEKAFITVINFLTLHSFFDINLIDTTSSLNILHTKPQHPVNQDIHQLAQTKLQNILKDTLKMAPLSDDKISKKVKNQGLMLNGKPWIKYVINLIEQLNKQQQLKSVLTLNSECQSQLESAKTLLSKIEKNLESEKEDQNNVNLGFYLILCYFIFYLNIEGASINVAIQDTIDCYNKLFPTKTKKKNKSKNKDTDEEEIEPIDVLIDLLISFLTKPYPLLKEVAEIAFERFTSLFKNSTIDLIFESLVNAEDDAAGLEEGDDELDDVEFDTIDQNELENIDDEIEEDDDEEEDSEEDDSEEDDLEDDEDEEDEIEDNELSEKIKAALGAAAVTSDNESDLNDEQMEAFDGPLSQIFIEGKKAKKEKRERKEIIRNFKSRLIEWISIFIINQPTNPLTIFTINPLLSYIKENIKSKDNQTSLNKASTILNKDIKKIRINDTFSGEEIESILNNTHKIAREAVINNTHHDIGKDCYSILRTLIHSIKELNTDQFDDYILKSYTESLDHFAINRNSKVKEEVYFDLVTIYPKLGWLIGIKLLGLINTEDKKWCLRAIKSSEILDKLLTASLRQNYFDDLQCTQFIPILQDKITMIVKTLVANDEQSGSIKVDQLRNLLKVPEKLKKYLEIHNRAQDYNYSSEDFLTHCEKLLSDPKYHNASLRDVVYRVTGEKFNNKDRVKDNSSSIKSDKPSKISSSTKTRPSNPPTRKPKKQKKE